MNKIAEIMARGIAAARYPGAAPRDLTKYKSITRDAQATLTALEQAGYVVVEKKQIGILENAIDFVRRWAWRDSPLSDSERLSAIMHHPTIAASQVQE